MNTRIFKIVIMLTVMALLVVLAGCGSLPQAMPNQVDACLTHVSHPLRGEPFGPRSEEDSLDTIGACAQWERGRVSFDTGLGYRYRDGGFYGDDFIFEGRVSVKLWER